MWYTPTMKDIIPLPRGLLFDMDGVLLHTTQSADLSWKLVCQRFAPSLGLSPDELEAALSASRRAYRQEIEQSAQKQQRDRLYPFETRREKVEQALIQVGEKNDALAIEMVHAFELLRDEHRQLTPAAHETLQMLRDYGLRLALVSNGNATYQRRKIAQHRIEPFFDAILLEEEFGVAKPDKRIFQAALAQLQILAQDAWMIGDNLLTDITGAMSLGIFTIWCSPTPANVLSDALPRPNRTIQTLTELFDLLREAGAHL